jgi:hypothetical protein
MIYAATREEIEARRKAFIRKWRLKHRAVADSLEEAGDELCGNLGDDVWLKAAYRGGCRACQNLPKGAIRHVERYHCHPVPSA